MADENGISQAVLVNEVLHVKGELGVVMLWMMEGVSMVTEILLMVRVKGAQRLVKQRMSKVDDIPQRRLTSPDQRPDRLSAVALGGTGYGKGKNRLAHASVVFPAAKKAMHEDDGRPAGMVSAASRLVQRIS